MSFETFQIRKLQLVSASGSHSISLKSGLNVISGPSNTGKSYVLDTVDFCFGAKKKPKPTEESQLLTQARLELSTAGGVKTIERTWEDEGDITVFNTPLDQTGSDQNPVALHSRHASDKTDNISQFLLSLFNSENIELRKNKHNGKQKLSFRTIVHFFLVDETDIISEKSPILGPNRVEDTALQSAFNYLITGKQDPNLSDGPDPKTTKAKKIAQIEVYQQLLEELSKSLLGKPSASELTEQLDQLTKSIDKATEEITEASSNITKASEIRTLAWRELQEAESRLIVIHELDQRFDLLNKHYASDLERLDFIADGAYATDQLQTVGCPLCGSRDGSFESNDGGTVASITEACEQEADKIRTLSRDLAQTREGLTTEKEFLFAKIRQLKQQIEEEDSEVERQLAPKIAASRQQLEELIKKKRESFEIEERWKRLDDYEKRKTKLEAERDALKENKKKIPLLDPIALHDFCQEVRQLLIEWHYITTDVVEFDEGSVDIKVGGKARRSNGKGVRALLHAAFTIGLMRYCIKNSMPHPGFVILDSPLTTFRGNDTRAAGDEVSGDVQVAFFESLAKTPDNQQIIVLENKTVAEATRRLINYEEFSGRVGIGRAGLL